jgi:hypothetical protein
MPAKRKRGRPSKAQLAAGQLGSWDRSAAKPAKSKARTLAAKALAAKRTEALTPAERSAIASAGGKAASHPQKLSKCEHCGGHFGARAMRRHIPLCKAARRR